MRFDLTDMQLFLKVLEQGSLTHAARESHLSLAAVSERLSGMESTLGATLVERGHRGVRATAAGEALARHARLILSQVEHMRGELRGFSTGLKGRIKILSNTAAATTFLPAHLCRFLAAHPDLSIDLDERPSEDIVVMLAEGKADFGVVAGFADISALQSHPVGLDQLVVLVPRSHPMAGEPGIEFEKLVDEPFVGMGAGSAIDRHIVEQGLRFGRQLNYRIRVRGVHEVATMVEAGVGIAILSEPAIEPLTRPGLAAIKLSDAWAQRRLYLCARDFEALPAHASLLARELIQRTVV